MYRIASSCPSRAREFQLPVNYHLLSRRQIKQHAVPKRTNLYLIRADSISVADTTHSRLMLFAAAPLSRTLSFSSLSRPAFGITRAEVGYY